VIRFLKPLCLSILLSVLTAACTPVVANRGNMPDPEQVLKVQPGVSSREDVAAVLGSPTTISPFDENRWYYLGQKTEQTAFLDPDTVDDQILKVTFNDRGIVDDIKLVDTSTKEDVTPVDRRTPTAGKEITVLEQLLGNLRHPTVSGKDKN
jgi:outer membrane protein assembly factor BamE (lipoprotein component of BamABCDE complex)